MSPVFFIVLGLFLGAANRGDRFPDLGLRSWWVVAFSGALLYTIPVVMFALPAWLLPPCVPIGCLLGAIFGYALAREAQDVLGRDFTG